LAIDWTAWGEIGMAARGSIPGIMKQAGIEMLSPKDGIPFIREELTSENATTEIVVANALGIMVKDFDPEGGLDAKGVDINQKVEEKAGIMLHKVHRWTLHNGLVVESMHDPKEQPFLYDHQINEVPVLPGVMGIEAMAEAATLFTPEGFAIQQIENVVFHAPFKFYKHEPRSVFVKVQHYLEKDDIVAHSILYGERKLLGQEAAQSKVHFTADIRLSKESLEPVLLEKISLTKSKNQIEVEKEAIYKVYFHGPAYQVIEKSWKKQNLQLAQFSKGLPGNHVPVEKKTFTQPRLIELCFQTAGVWEMGKLNRMGLPNGIDRLRIYGKPKDGRTQLFALTEPIDGRFNASIVDKKGNVYMRLEGYTTAEFNSALDNELIKPITNAVL
jgi:hypothetical protein